MFRIVALAYVIFAGQPPDAPLLFNHDKSFMTQDACSDYLKSEKFKADRAKFLDDVLGAIPAPAPDDDTAIRPDVAITASCEQDHRI